MMERTDLMISASTSQRHGCANNYPVAPTGELSVLHGQRI